MYEDWLLDARAQLERQCVDLCDLACAARARAGDLAGAVEAARRRVQLQPLEEIGYRTLMELQADLGDRGAVSTYHHCASVLERELGVAPDPSTRRAFQRLMAHARLAVRPPAVASAAAGRPGLAAAQLVGRSAELSVLLDVRRAAVAGRRGLVLVRGGAGVGKTRLVAEVAEMARLQGGVVAHARCFGAAGQLALAPVADWLRNDAVQSAVATLDPAWGAEVGRLVPAGGRAGSSRATADAWQRHRFLEGLARALIAVRRPLLLVLDNAQWCDQETLAFITFCLGLADGARLLVAAASRQDGLDGDRELAGWIVRMRATGLLTEVPLGPLEAADSARLAEAISGQPLPEARADLLQAATGGFPLYIIEAARGTADPDGTSLPVGDLAAVLRKRLGRGTMSAREVAGLAAAVGTNFTLDLLTEASDLDADLVVEAVDELWRRRIIREFRDGYDFSHDLLREAAYAGISPPRRWLLIGASPGAWNYSMPRMRTASRPSSPSSMHGPDGPSGQRLTTSRQPMSPPAGSPTPSRSGYTRRRCPSSRPCRRDGTGIPASSRCWRRWRHRSTHGTATGRRTCSRLWNARSPWPSRWAAGTRGSSVRQLGDQFVVVLGEVVEHHRLHFR